MSEHLDTCGLAADVQVAVLKSLKGLRYDQCPNIKDLINQFVDGVAVRVEKPKHPQTGFLPVEDFLPDDEKLARGEL